MHAIWKKSKIWCTDERKTSRNKIFSKPLLPYRDEHKHKIHQKSLRASKMNQSDLENRLGQTWNQTRHTFREKKITLHRLRNYMSNKITIGQKGNLRKLKMALTSTSECGERIKSGTTGVFLMLREGAASVHFHAQEVWDSHEQWWDICPGVIVKTVLCTPLEMVAVVLHLPTLRVELLSSTNFPNNDQTGSSHTCSPQVQDRHRRWRS